MASFFSSGSSECESQKFLTNMCVFSSYVQENDLDSSYHVYVAYIYIYIHIYIYIIIYPYNKYINTHTYVYI